jgi:adenosine/AMP kinase
MDLAKEKSTGSLCNCEKELAKEIGQIVEKPQTCQLECGMALNDAIVDMLIEEDGNDNETTKTMVNGWI